MSDPATPAETSPAPAAGRPILADDTVQVVTLASGAVLTLPAGATASPRLRAALDSMICAAAAPVESGTIVRAHVSVSLNPHPDSTTWYNVTLVSAAPPATPLPLPAAVPGGRCSILADVMDHC
jgi:hypothetical protein